MIWLDWHKGQLILRCMGRISKKEQSWLFGWCWYGIPNFENEISLRGKNVMPVGYLESKMGNWHQLSNKLYWFKNMGQSELGNMFPISKKKKKKEPVYTYISLSLSHLITISIHGNIHFHRRPSRFTAHALD